jgi:hypothetical protein
MERDLPATDPVALAPPVCEARFSRRAPGFPAARLRAVAAASIHTVAASQRVADLRSPFSRVNRSAKG